jgi:serine/threonine protein kinase
MGPPQLGHARARHKLGRIGSRFGSDQDYKSNAGQVGTSSAGGSCQAIPDGVDALSRYDCGVITAASLGLGPDDSGELFTSSVACSDSTCGSISRPSISAVVVDANSSRLAGSALTPALNAELGRFRLVSVLGQGEHASVYRAYDPVLERDVALKVPRQAILKTAKAVERFLGEARALARLRHPYIVPVYEAGCVGERHYIAMALIDGCSLAEQLATRTIPLDRAVEIIAELAEALTYAHGQGVVHRDVKPANIRVDNRGAVYLMDFGIAYRPDSGEVPLPPGVILGTPAYLAPEQAEGGQTTVLPASDQYSLGVVFYELLCGRPPFCGPPSYVLFHAIHELPASPCTVSSRVPRSLSAVCLKALAKRPEQRFSSCEEFADALWQWLRREKRRAQRRAWIPLGG